jgi:uncharacterized protein (TIGR02246 family)
MKKLLIAILLLTACASTPRPDAASEVKQHFTRGIEAFNRHDLETFLTQFDENLQMYAAFNWLRGRAAIRERFVTTFRDYPNVKMEIHDLHAREVAPGVVTVDFRFKTWPKGEGPAWHGVGSGVYVRRDGRWVEVLEHETVTRVDEGLR